MTPDQLYVRLVKAGIAIFIAVSVLWWACLLYRVMRLVIQ